VSTREFGVKTSKRSEMIDITSEIQDSIDEMGLEEGLVLVYCPHTTAGVTVNEGADPAVAKDILNKLDEIIPWEGDYRHAEGNSPAHIKSTLVGSSVSLWVDGGRISLGTWQKVFFCEFDGPRNRKVQVRTQG
jgi:secondary thiamine-phosphate synthase enzyme